MAFVALCWVAPSAGATAAPHPVVVTGKAGYLAHVRLGTSARAGRLTATASRGGWAAALVVQPTSRSSETWPQWSVVDFTKAFRCPGGSCPWPFDDSGGTQVSEPHDAKGFTTFARGTIDVMLFGEIGSTVTVTVHFDREAGAPVRVRAADRPEASIMAADIGSRTPQTSTALHTWHQLSRSPRQRYAFVASWTAYSSEPAGELTESYCLSDFSSEGGALGGAGGAAPCGDFEGEDFMFGPQTDVLLPAAGPIPTGTFGAMTYGPHTENVGVGLDATLAGANVYMQQVTIGVALR
jgi:hypothetical protein